VRTTKLTEFHAKVNMDGSLITRLTYFTHGLQSVPECDKKNENKSLHVVSYSVNDILQRIIQSGVTQ
jgi:hypothetical protein